MYRYYPAGFLLAMICARIATKIVDHNLAVLGVVTFSFGALVLLYASITADWSRP